MIGKLNVTEEERNSMTDKKTDTPLTDILEFNWYEDCTPEMDEDWGYMVVEADKCREIEREKLYWRGKYFELLNAKGKDNNE